MSIRSSRRPVPGGPRSHPIGPWGGLSSRPTSPSAPMGSVATNSSSAPNPDDGSPVTMEETQPPPHHPSGSAPEAPPPPEEPSPGDNGPGYQSVPWEGQRNPTLPSTNACPSEAAPDHRDSNNADDDADANGKGGKHVAGQEEELLHDVPIESGTVGCMWHCTHAWLLILPGSLPCRLRRCAQSPLLLQH